MELTERDEVFKAYWDDYNVGTERVNSFRPVVENLFARYYGGTLTSREFFDAVIRVSSEKRQEGPQPMPPWVYDSDIREVPALEEMDYKEYGAMMGDRSPKRHLSIDGMLYQCGREVGKTHTGVIRSVTEWKANRLVKVRDKYGVTAELANLRFCANCDASVMGAHGY